MSDYLVTLPLFMRILLLLALAAGVGALTRLLLSSRIVRFSERRRLPLVRDALLGLRGPVTWSVACWILHMGIPYLDLPAKTALASGRVTKLILYFGIVVLAYRGVTVLQKVFGSFASRTQGKLDDQLVPLLARIGKGLVVLLGFLFILQNQGVNVSGLLAGLGLGGLAVALAAKDTLENLFGSFTIFVDRPFQIGDWVIVAGDVEGTVEDVGIRTTRIRTFANSLVSVPNSKVANSTINNMGRRSHRRVTTTIGVPYSTPRERLERYVARLNEIIQEHDNTWKQNVEIHFYEFGASALEIKVYFFLDVPDWHKELRARHQIFMSFIEAAEQVGVSMAFPSTSVYVEKWPPGLGSVSASGEISPPAKEKGAS